MMVMSANIRTRDQRPRQAISASCRGSSVPTVRRSVKIALHYEDWTADVAHNGREAIAKFDKAGPDVPVLEIMLPPARRAPVTARKGIPMREPDIRSVAGLAGEAGEVLTTLVRDVHSGIAGRVFCAIGPTAKPTRVVHDAISHTVYQALRGGIRGASRVGGTWAGRVWGREDDPPLERRPKIRAAAAALNGLYGHQLAAHGNDFAPPMQIRSDDEVVALTTDAIATANPAAARRIVFFPTGCF